MITSIVIIVKNVMLAFRFAKNDFNWNPIDKMAAFLPWMDKKVKTGFWVSEGPKKWQKLNNFFKIINQLLIVQTKADFDVNYP